MGKWSGRKVNWLFQQHNIFKELGKVSGRVVNLLWWQYFDNKNLSFGYGGYKYDGRFKNNVKNIIRFFKLSKKLRIAEFGCEKGFVLVEFLKKKLYSLWRRFNILTSTRD